MQKNSNNANEIESIKAKIKRNRYCAILCVVIAFVLFLVVGPSKLLAYFSSVKSTTNSFTILPPHELTYSYYEVDGNGTRTLLERTETENHFAGYHVILGQDPSHTIVNSNYVSREFVIDNVVRPVNYDFTMPASDATIEQNYYLACYSVSTTNGIQKFRTLQEAFDNADLTGSTITVLRDVTETTTPVLSTAQENKNVILDLQGKTLTLDNSTITNNGTLTITDSYTTGKITSTGTAITNNGILTLGINDSTTLTTAPEIIGEINGIVNGQNSTFNFYDGVVKGQTSTVNTQNVTVNTPTGYRIVNSTETIDGDTYNVATLSNLYTVTYDCGTNGGQISIDNAQTTFTEQVAYGTQVDLTKFAYKQGSEIVGWNTDSNATAGLASLTMPASDITVYAIFESLAPDAVIINAKINNANGADYVPGTWTNQNVYIELSEADPNADVTRYEIYKNGQWTTTGITFANNIGTITITDDMDDTVRFRAVNSNGVPSDESTILIKKDSVKPTVTYNGAFGEGDTLVTVTVTLADQGGSGLVTTRPHVYRSTDPNSFSGSGSILNNGESHTFTANNNENTYIFVEYVSDNAGNICEDTANTVEINGTKYYRFGPYDRIKPVIQIETVDYNTFRWSATDDSTLTSYGIVESSTTSSSEPETWSQITGNATGTYDINTVTAQYYHAWVKDEYGNKNHDYARPIRLTKNIASYTTLELRNIDENGEVINPDYVLPGCDIYVTGIAATGYHDLVITVDGVDYQPGSVVSIGNAATTITTNATLNTYNVTYDLAGGQIAAGDTLVTSVTYNNRFSVPNPASRSGYTFLGWSSSVADGLGPNAKTGVLGGSYLTSFVDWDGTATTNKGFYNLTDVNEGTVKLTAIWKANADKPVITAKLNNAQGDSYTPNKWTNQNVYIELSQANTDNQIDHYEWYRNGEWVSTGITTTNNVGVLTISENIDEELRFRAVSVTNHVSPEETIIVRRDNINPTIVYTATQTADYSKVTMSITCADTGGSGLFTGLEQGRTQFNVWKSTSANSLSTNNYTSYSSNKDGTSFDINLATTGDYYIFIQRIRDNAYNYSVANADLITIDGKDYYRVGPFRYDITAPVVTIEPVDYNTFRWSATDLSNIVSYNVTVTTGTNAQEPAEWIDLNGATFATYDIDTTVSRYYTVWVKDEYGNVGKKFISPSRLYKDQGANTTLQIRENDANGVEFTNTYTYIMEGTQLYVQVDLVPSTGYNVSIDKNSTTIAQGTTTANTTTTHNGSIRISSKATPYTYTINYDYDGGQAGSGVVTTSTTYGTRINVNAPTKTGYTFTGWTSNSTDGLGPNAKTAQYSGTAINSFAAWNGSVTLNKGFLNLTDVNEGTVTLTANWAKNNYEVLSASSSHIAYYETLEEALANVQSGQKIKVLANVTDTSTPVLSSGKNVTLDLNGCTVTASNTLTNNGTLTILDNNSETDGKITSSATTGIINNGTLTIGNNDGTVAGSEPEISGSEYGIINNQGGTFNFYDGVVIGSAGNSISGTVTNVPTGRTVCKYPDNGNEVAILGGEAKFAPGQQVNVAIKSLAAGSTVSDYTTTDTNVTAIAQYNGASMPTNVNAVRVDDTTSEAPIFMWYDNGTIYWWSSDTTPSLNEDASYTFYRLHNLVDIDGVSSFNTINTTNMRAIFAKSGSAQASPADVDALAGWDVDNVTSMKAMFQHWGDLVDVDGLSGWNTESVENMNNMFRGADSLTNVDGLENWDTQSLTDMSSIFYECSSLVNVEGIESWNTSNVETFDGAFVRCTSLTNVDFSNFDTSSAEIMSGMFAGCTSLQVLDLSKFDTSNVTEMIQMFQECRSLTTIYASTDFVTTNVTDSTGMFDGCIAPLDGGNGTTYNSSNPKDKTYAHLDGGVSNPGYFRINPDVYKYVELNNGQIVNQYEYLYEALDNMTSGNTIKTLADADENYSDPIINTKTAILDLNGHTITIHNQTFTNTGNLTINDADNNGRLSCDECCIANNGTGELTINGGYFDTTVTGAGHTFSVIDQNSTGLVTINDGQLVAADLAIAVNNSGIVCVNGGMIYAPDEAAIYTYNANTSVEVNGGNIEGHVAIYTETGVNVTITGTPILRGTVYEGIKVQEGSVTVTGGENSGPTIIGKHYGISTTTGSITVTGASHIVGQERFGIDVRNGGTLTLGTDDGTVSQTYPLVESQDQTNTYYGVYMRNNTGTFNFYDGKIIAPAGKSIVGNVTDKPDDRVVCKYPENGKEIAILAGEAKFADGKTVNKAMKSLVTGTTAEYSTTDTSITTIAKYTGVSMPSNVTSVRVDATDSEAPIFMWYDNGTIYWYSSDSTPTLNEDASYMFYRLQNMTNIDGVSTFDTLNTTNMRAMFAKSESVQPSPTNVDALENWEIGNVTQLRGFFQNWGDLEDVDGLSNWDTSSVETMNNLFRCNNSLADISGLESWNTENVVEMYSMFYECTSLTSIEPIEMWNTSSVETFEAMFLRCSALTEIDLSHYNTSSAQNMAAMFGECTGVEIIDVSSFQTSNVTNMTQMFNSCPNLRTIYATNSFVTAAVTESDYMFDECSAPLDGGNGTTYNTTNPKDKTYAHLDGGTQYPGYFRVNTNVYKYLEVQSNGTIINLYPTLQEAFDSATSGNTIKALVSHTDASTSAPTVVDGKTLKLDMAGNEVTLTYRIENYGTLDIYTSANGGKLNRNGVVLNNRTGGTLTTNGTSSSGTLAIVNTTTDGSAASTVIQSYGSLTLNTNTTVTYENPATSGTANWYTVYVVDGTTTVNGATISNMLGGTSNELGIIIKTNAPNAKIIVNSGTVEASSIAVWNGGSTQNTTANPAIKVAGGTVRSTGDNAIKNSVENSLVYITGGTVYSTGANTIMSDGNVTMTGGTVYAYSGMGVSVYGNSTATISGGLISKEINPVTNTWVGGACFQINGSATATLSGTAVIQNKAGNGSNVLYNASSGTLTIDGATVQNLGTPYAGTNASTGTIYVKFGTVTTTGQSVLYNSNDSGPIIIGESGSNSTTSPVVTGQVTGGLDAGPITINGGKLSSTTNMTIRSYGNITINGGLIENNTVDTGSNWPYTVFIDSNDALITVNGGTITNNTHSSVVVKNGTTGDITINGGTITATSSTAVLNNGGDTIITGGTITSTGGNGVTCSSGTVTVGDIAAPVTSVDNGTATEPRITGSAYGVQVGSSGTFNFYDGVIKGKNGAGSAISASTVNTPTNYEVAKVLSGNTETATLGLLQNLYVLANNNNIVQNGGFESYSISNPATGTVNGHTHTWDGNLNGIPGNTTKAYFITNWGRGENMGVVVPELGYHAHMRIVDGNNVVRFKTNEAYAGKTGADAPDGESIKPGTISTARWLGISSALSASDLHAGGVYAITLDVYRVSGSGYVTAALMYGTTANTTAHFENSENTTNIFRPTTTGSWQTITLLTTVSNDYVSTTTPRIYVYGHMGGQSEIYVDNVRVEEVTPISKAYGSAYTSTELATPTRSGCTFGGWYNNGTFSTQISVGDAFTTSTATFKDATTVNSPAFIYAKWTQNGNVVKSASNTNAAMGPKPEDEKFYFGDTSLNEKNDITSSDDKNKNQEENNNQQKDNKQKDVKDEVELTSDNNDDKAEDSTKDEQDKKSEEETEEKTQENNETTSEHNSEEKTEETSNTDSENKSEEKSTDSEQNVDNTPEVSD